MLISLLSTMAFADPSSETVDAVYRELSLRHPVACSIIFTDRDDKEVLEAMIWVADNAEQPPWAGMRAVACVVEEAEDHVFAMTKVHSWLADAQRPGFALTIVRNLDLLHEQVAVDLAQRSLHHRGRTDAVTRRFDVALANSRHAPVVRFAGDEK